MTCGFLVADPSVSDHSRQNPGQEMDVRQLQIEDNSFDVAIDKGK